MPTGNTLTIPARPKTSFAGDVLKLVSGTTLAQLLGILAAPLLTRLYTPEDFGTLALFTSITNIVCVFSCLRYEISIMLPDTDQEAANLLAVSLIFAVITSLLMLPLVFTMGRVFIAWINAPMLASTLWLIPLAVFVGATSVALNYWNTRTKNFSHLATVRVTNATVSLSAQVGFGYSTYATSGTLILGHIAGQLTGVTILLERLGRVNSQLLLKSVRFENMISAARRHYRFPLFGTWAALLNTISWQLPAFLLSFYFSPAVVGYYALGLRLIQTPMSLIGNSIGQVFFQRASAARAQGILPQLVEDTFRELVRIGFLPMVTLSIIGRDLFVFAFGQHWAEAGIYTQILGIWAFFWFVSSPMSTLFAVHEKQGLSLLWNIFLILTRFISLALGGYYQDARLSIVLISLTGTLIYGVLNIYLIFISGSSAKKILNIFTHEFLHMIPSILLISLVNIVNVNILMNLLISLLSITLFYIFKYRIHSLLYKISLTS